jgi:hypothetical protein
MLRAASGFDHLIITEYFPALLLTFWLINKIITLPLALKGRTSALIFEPDYLLPRKKVFSIIIWHQAIEMPGTSALTFHF